MARKSILDFRGKNRLFSGTLRDGEGNGGVVRFRACVAAKKCCVNGWSRYRTTFHLRNIFSSCFALHRLGVSGLQKRRERGFRAVGGGVTVLKKSTSSKVIAYYIHISSLSVFRNLLFSVY